jgi:hypothetical protein
MKRTRLVAIGIVLITFTAIAWADGPVGTVTWISGYPQELSTGTIYGRGNMDYPSTWTLVTGTMTAYLASDSTDEYYTYDSTLLFPITGDYKWEATIGNLPPGDYTVVVQVNLQDQCGDKEIIVADIAAVTVGGTQKKVVPGEIKSTSLTGTKLTITGAGTFKTKAGYEVALASFSVLALPMDALGLHYDSTRKAVTGTVTVDAINGKWNTTITTGIEKGKYRVFVGATFSEIGTTNRQKWATFEYVDVTN